MFRLLFKERSAAGMSLIEILVAFALMILILMAGMTMSDTSSRRKLESTLDDIERAVKFASNEAILRNAIVRLTFKLDTLPVEYVVEYGPSDSFRLPQFQELTDLSLKEQEKYLERLKQVDRQFNKVPQFDEITRALDENLRVLGVATSLYPGFQTQIPTAIYFYPNGERDSALVVLATDEEMATINIEPYTSKTENEFFQLKPPEMVNDWDEFLYEQAAGVYHEWAQ